MLIKSITLHNFRQFKGKQKLEFSSDSDKNVTVLLGDNTFGKTTILQSFNWCLYGVADFPKDSNPAFLLNLEVANELAGVQQKCEVYVELILEHKGMEYIILRKQPYIDRGYGNWTALQSQLSVSYKESGITKQVREGEEQRIINSIRDGYELFYVIKSSLDMWHEKQLAIRCRRVPTIVLGDASEEDQAIGLLKEISPVAYFDYYEFYEERYGVRKESAQANPVIANALSAYYIDGQYIIDVPAIDERDVQQVLDALSEKSLWFIEDIENLFDRICQYTPHDAINAAAFRRIGYTLNSSYVYCSSYGTALNFFEETVFSKDIVDLTSLDRRMVNLGMFAAALDKKKKTLEYIETAPKILMSIEKIRTVYDLSVEEIREIQSLMSVFYDEPFFNGRSIWAEVENLPIVQKLQGNDWMLTCIMRQQDAVASLSVAGGIILSLESASLNLSRICEWIASTHGKMSITNLEHTFNETFGTRIPASKLAEKLRTSGSWDAVVTDSMDEYIDSLVDAGLSDIDADDLLQEEFF